MTHRFELRDSTAGLASLQWPRKANLVFTSPPYYRARDYTPAVANKLGKQPAVASDAAQLGHEPTPYDYVRRLAATFASGDQFLAPDGSLFVVLGDTFARQDYVDADNIYPPVHKGESIGIYALFVSEMRRAGGWRLWQEIVWNKMSVPPSGAAHVRCNPSTERIFWFVLGTKPKFDARAIREEGKTKAGTLMPPVGGAKYADSSACAPIVSDGKRCRRDIWDICPSRSKLAHVAPFPEQLVEVAMQACTTAGDLVVDPYAGTLTVRNVARRLQRASVSFDIFDHTNELSN